MRSAWKGIRRIPFSQLKHPNPEACLRHPIGHDRSAEAGSHDYRIESFLAGHDQYLELRDSATKRTTFQKNSQMYGYVNLRVEPASTLRRRFPASRIRVIVLVSN